MYRIVVAPDKFKGTLTAAEAADTIADVVSEIMPGTDIAVIPMADGGEGTAMTIGTNRGYSRSLIDCFDPLMRPVMAEVWISSDRRSAVIDSSAVIGLSLVAPDHCDPWKSTSYGLGYAAKKLLDSGISTLEIGIGGTATVDAVIGSRIYSGAATVIDSCRVFDPRPDLVITGEGRFDDQSLTGKLTGAIMHRCHDNGIACRVIAGSVEGDVTAEVYDASRYSGSDVLSRGEVIDRVRRAVAAALLEFLRDNNS